MCDLSTLPMMGFTTARGFQCRQTKSCASAAVRWSAWHMGVRFDNETGTPVAKMPNRRFRWRLFSMDKWRCTSGLQIQISVSGIRFPINEANLVDPGVFTSAIFRTSRFDSVQRDRVKIDLVWTGSWGRGNDKEQ